MDSGTLFFLYFVFWIVYATGTTLLVRKKSAEFKRKYNPVISGLFFVFFLTFIWLAIPGIKFFLIMFTVVVVYFFVEWKGSRYCDSCGKDLGNKFISKEVREATNCSKCGAKLIDQN